MNLENILKEMDLNRANAEMDVTLGSPNTHGGRIGLKRAATETMRHLKLDYRNELMESTVYIVVTGSERDSFNALASSETFGCFTADPDEFYKNLTSRINPTLFGREGARQLFNIAGNVLEDKMMELDIGSYNMLQFNEKYNRAVNNAEDFVPIIREAINDKVGAEIVGINAVHSILDSAIARKHSDLVTPVLLNVTDEKFALDLYKGLPELVKHGVLTNAQYEAKKKNKAFLVVAGKASKTLRSTEGVVIVKTVNESSVGEALESIRNKIL
jgi:hypothetical protein